LQQAWEISVPDYLGVEPDSAVGCQAQPKVTLWCQACRIALRRDGAHEEALSVRLGQDTLENEHYQQECQHTANCPANFPFRTQSPPSI